MLLLPLEMISRIPCKHLTCIRDACMGCETSLQTWDTSISHASEMLAWDARHHSKHGIQASHMHQRCLHGMRDIIPNMGYKHLTCIRDACMGCETSFQTWDTSISHASEMLAWDARHHSKHGIQASHMHQRCLHGMRDIIPNMGYKHLTCIRDACMGCKTSFQTWDTSISHASEMLVSHVWSHCISVKLRIPQFTFFDSMVLPYSFQVTFNVQQWLQQTISWSKNSNNKTCIDISQILNEDDLEEKTVIALQQARTPDSSTH